VVPLPVHLKPRRRPPHAPIRRGSSGRWRVSARSALACLLAPLVGSTRIQLSAVFDRSIPYADNIDAQIFFVARLPRVLAAALVGASLALSGVVFQALLRNPLASPDTLGVSAGASLGAMMAITFNLDFRCSASRPCRWRASPGRSARSPSCTAFRRRDAAARPPSCCCSAA
jgi:hypothetical protein